jgi:aspartate kinase
MINNNNTLVMKFGGTSVGSVEAMAQAVQIVLNAHQDWKRLVVVTSALSGITNLLLDSADAATRGDIHPSSLAAQKIRTAHFTIIEALIKDLNRQSQLKSTTEHFIQDFSNLCHAISILGEATPRALDAVASLGERMCAPILAAALEDAGLPSQPVESYQIVITDNDFQSSHPDFAATTQATRAVLNPILDKGQVPVVTGFIGGTPNGVITTLGRGGSDYSAAILGAVLPANEVWIWTDVDGVMTADPRLTPAAHTIPELSFREIGELAYYGAKVLHPKTIRPVIEAGIGLRVLNTFNPTHPGTRLVADTANVCDSVIKAVTAIKGLSLITLEGRGMLGVPGVAARTFAAVAASGTSVPLITQASSEQSICFAVPIEASEKVILALQNTFAHEIASKDIDRVWGTTEVAIITVVGAGMRNIPGVAGRVFTALGQNKVNVIAIAQGSSEVSISLVADAASAKAAVQALHELIII